MHHSSWLSRRAALAVAFAGTVSVLGCKKKETDAYAVIPKGTTHEFWKSVHAGAEKAAAELGVKTIWKGALREDDREDQIKVVESFINLRVKGILLAPLDDTALGGVVTDAVRSKIPVVIFDSDLKGNDFASFVATDNKKGGVLAGEHMGKLLGGKGQVIMLRYAEGSASTAAREQGFLDGIAKFPEIKVVSSNQYGGATTETAFKAAENLLAAHKDPSGLTVQGIFCPNESTTFGMLRALEDGAQAGKVKFIGFDSSPKLVDAMTKGHIEALVVQDPINMGYLGLKTLVAHVRGEKIDRRVDTGATLIARDAMEQPRMKELLAPDFKRWLKE